MPTLKTPCGTRKMHTKPIADIAITNRIRSVDNITDLANDIAEKGLFHPILLTKDTSTLIAGEHRLRAIQHLHDSGVEITYNSLPIPVGTIPFTTLSTSNSYLEQEAELTENIKRVQLSWQEESKAIARLHQLRVDQAESEGRKHRQSDTQEELEEKSSSIVTRALVVSRFLDDADVRKAGTQKEALKIIDTKLKKQKQESLAASYDLDSITSSHKLINGDMLTELPKLETASVDLIISDPPYGINIDKAPNMSAEKHSYDDTEDVSNELISLIATEGYRVTKTQAHLYLFCDIRRFLDLSAIFESAGWYVWKTPLIWYKGPSVGIAPRPLHGPRRVYEAILYAIKGDKEVLDMGTDILSIPHDKTIQRGAHKPSDLYRVLIERSCPAGSTILDPTAGTGPIIPAANATKTLAIAIELEKAAFGQMLERLKNED